jgi:hypothetical protein
LFSEKKRGREDVSLDTVEACRVDTYIRYTEKNPAEERIMNSQGTEAASNRKRVPVGNERTEGNEYKWTKEVSGQTLSLA